MRETGIETEVEIEVVDITGLSTWSGGWCQGGLPGTVGLGAVPDEARGVGTGREDRSTDPEAATQAHRRRPPPIAPGSPPRAQPLPIAPGSPPRAQPLPIAPGSPPRGQPPPIAPGPPPRGQPPPIPMGPPRRALSTLGEQARRLGISLGLARALDRHVRRAGREAAARSSEASDPAPHPAQACREALFALALAVTRHPEIEGGSREGFLERWLALDTPAVRVAWQELAINASFWVRLDDGQRARVGAWLGQEGIAPRKARRRLERLLASPIFAGAGVARRDGLLGEIGVPGSAGLASAGPASAGPASARPTSAGPASARPTSAGPTSARPTSAGPTSAGPASAGPTSAGPEAAGPTSAGPEAAGPEVEGPGSAGPEAAGLRSEVQAGLVQPGGEGGAAGGGVVGGAVPAGGVRRLGLTGQAVGAGVHPGEGGGVGGIVGVHPGEGVLAGGRHVAAAGAGAGVGL